MTARNVLLKLHLIMGVSAALFLIILGLTGSVIAFEGDIDHWIRPGLWYVTPAAQTLPEAKLILDCERRFAPARVAAIQVYRDRNLARSLEMTDGATVQVNPFTGAILGRIKGPTRTQTLLGYIHQIHLRLVPDPRAMPNLAAAGKIIVTWAGLLLCLLVPTGVVLFVRTRRFQIKWNASWFRKCFDAHHVVGIYAAIFLFLAAFTGILIGFDFGEKALYLITGSKRPARPAQAHSIPSPGAPRIDADRTAAIARNAMPGANVAGIFIPLKAGDVYIVLMRVPEETSEAVHSTVSIDQYSGKVLGRRNFMTDSRGYRAIRFNRSIHTGDVLGGAGHVVASVSSLALAIMALTGLVIWWKKLAV